MVKISRLCKDFVDVSLYLPEDDDRDEVEPEPPAPLDPALDGVADPKISLNTGNKIRTG